MKSRDGKALFARRSNPAAGTKQNAQGEHLIMEAKFNKYVYSFGGGSAEGNKSMKPLLGGKGANLAEMSAIGLPVPPGVTITTEACRYFEETNGRWPAELKDQLNEGIWFIERKLGARFGDPENPLLVSVRSGAAASMPGMMDTVLNLGINDEVVEGMARRTGNDRFAYDSYRRFIDMFGDVVMGVPHEEFEHAMAGLKKERGVEKDTDLTAGDLKELVDRFKAVYRKNTGFMFPNDPREQLKFAVDAVFKSWKSARAVKYRQINKITGLIGTAVNVQAMVYGNMGETSGTGVLFTRNPNTGEKVLYGEFLMNAQGEDVVAGIRTPEHVSELEKVMPSAYHELHEICMRLESYYKNMQDIEFTIQNGKLYILQTRDGKRTGHAAVQIAVDLVKEGLVSEEEAVERLVEPRHIEQLLHPQLASSEINKADVLGTGLPASPGAAAGKVVFNPDDAEKMRAAGDRVILVRVETSPEDVGGMAAAEAILTSRGGMTSHAAVVARGWGKPCVVGCNDIVINYKTKSFTNGHVTVKEGEYITIDGTTGRVIKGKLELVEPTFSGAYAEYMKWVDDCHAMGVRANADTPVDARKARDNGAVGIGLCRTEHMFFGESRILAVRKMILAETTEERKKSLSTLLPYQKEDFRGIFKEMAGLPVTIRLLDPPLHEFLPAEPSEVHHVAVEMGVSDHTLNRKINQLKEFNPMMGHRGCRLGITFPEITEMQTRAILEAAVELKKEGVVVIPEIMVPLIGTVEEFLHQKHVIEATAASVFEDLGLKIEFKIGTMIEVPRAALTAEAIAAESDFFSFGTNDLTQMTFGYSRDDAGKFLQVYLQEKILKTDPFQSIDREGVGQLVKLAATNGRVANRTLKVGVCGEHGGDPSSIEFFTSVPLDYVSCSPYRVPVARLAAAQSSIAFNKAVKKAVLH
jgi:pyruvate,orthophosphate dikinase